jgi:hypothetical protein
VREETGNHRFGSLGFLLAMKSIPADLEPTLRAMITSDYVWERIWARQALCQLGIPEDERDAMIMAMVKSPQSAERLEGSRMLIHLGRPQQAVPVLQEIADRGSKEDRARADVLLLYGAMPADRDRP